MKRFSSKRVQQSILAVFVFYFIPSFAGTTGPVNQSNNFVFVGVGAQQPSFSSSMRVGNDSLFPAPSNQDFYTVTDNHINPLIAVFIGKRWQREKKIFPAFSVGLRYESLFQTVINGTITQYTLADFKNYDYQWKIASNLFFASAKLNLFQSQTLLPFITGGLGVAVNRTSGYRETALSDVTARTTPGFTNRTNSQFSYHVGAGVDVPFTKQWIGSLAYQYMDLGKISSGSGMNTWSNQSLNLGRYRSNAVLIGATYLV
jgi:opacity protein-like surface antigen